MRIERLAKIGGLATALIGITGVLASEHCVQTHMEINQGILKTQGRNDLLMGCKTDFPQDKAEFRSCLQRGANEVAVQKAKPAICNENSPDKVLVLFDESLNRLRKGVAKGSKPPAFNSFLPEHWELEGYKERLLGRVKELCIPKSASVASKIDAFLHSMR